MDELCEVRVNSPNAVTNFSNNLGDLIRERDISEEKLKYSLKNLKFEGYDSDMDVYTFRAEFEKLIEPVIQKKTVAGISKEELSFW